MEISTTKNIYDKMASQQFVVSLMGNFDQELILTLIRITDNKLSGLDMQDSIKRKIFHFMVECSQNLLKINTASAKEGHKNIFLIGQEGEQYTVHLGGTLSKNALTPLLKTIADVNVIDSSEIKQKYIDELCSTDLLGMNPSLLSMLSISKKTKRKIEYDLIDIDDASSFLAFKMTISN